LSRPLISRDGFLQYQVTLGGMNGRIRRCFRSRLLRSARSHSQILEFAVMRTADTPNLHLLFVECQAYHVISCTRAPFPLASHLISIRAGVHQIDTVNQQIRCSSTSDLQPKAANLAGVPLRRPRARTGRKPETLSCSETMRNLIPRCQLGHTGIKAAFAAPRARRQRRARPWEARPAARQATSCASVR
jgi:hypothetical protein